MENLSSYKKEMALRFKNSGKFDYTDKYIDKATYGQSGIPQIYAFLCPLNILVVTISHCIADFLLTA